MAGELLVSITLVKDCREWQERSGALQGGEHDSWVEENLAIVKYRYGKKFAGFLAEEDGQWVFIPHDANLMGLAGKKFANWNMASSFIKAVLLLQPPTWK